VTQRALSRINLDWVAGSTAAYNTIRVFEQWSTFNPAFADRDTTAQMPPALVLTLLPTALRQAPCPIFCARPTIRRNSWLALTFFRRPSSRVLFFGRLKYRSFSNDSNTVWPSGDFCHNLQIFLCRFIFVTSQLSTDIVCYGSVLFSVSEYYLFLCGIFFCMYSFDNLSSSLGSISSALALPVSRGRHGKLVNNFSHESDVTSLQDPFTSRPYKTPF